MKKLSALLLIFAAYSACAQVVISPSDNISNLVKQVDTDSLRSYINRLTSFASRHSHSSHKAADRQIGAAQEWVAAKFKELNPALEVEIESYMLPPTTRVKTEQQYRNVVARLKGSDDRIIIISGHLDSRAADGNDPNSYSPGANDDGSSIASMLEIARVLRGQKFDATILFTAFSGEEVGLRGAGAVAEKAAGQGWNIIAVLNSDMIGQSTSNGNGLNDNTRVRVFSEGVAANETHEQRRIRVLNALENDSPHRQLARYVKEVGERYVDNLEVVMIYRNDRFGRGGDHTPFVNKGYPAVRLTEINENFDRQHKDITPETRAKMGDVPEAMDFEYLRKTASLNLAVAAAMASAPATPSDVKISLSNSDNHSNISWKGGAEGYYVVMRETFSPVWQKKFFTKESSIKLPYSRDNYIFGVQAVGKNGVESVVAVATAGQ